MSSPVPPLGPIKFLFSLPTLTSFSFIRNYSLLTQAPGRGGQVDGVHLPSIILCPVKWSTHSRSLQCTPTTTSLFHTHIIPALMAKSCKMSILPSVVILRMSNYLRLWDLPKPIRCSHLGPRALDHFCSCSLKSLLLCPPSCSYILMHLFSKKVITALCHIKCA